MTKGKGSSRSTQRIVRTPATKFGHLQKKTRQTIATKNTKDTKKGQYR